MTSKIVSITRGSQRCDHCSRPIKVLCAIETDGQFQTVGSSCVVKFIPELEGQLNQKMRIFTATERQLAKVRAAEDRQAKRKLEFEARMDGSPVVGENLVRIVEPLLIHGLSAMLLDDGFSITEDETIFSAPTPEDQMKALDTYEGLAPIVATNPEYLEAVSFLRNYVGNFGFLNSLKSQLETQGSLSDRQLDGAVKCMNNAKARAAQPTIELIGALVTVKRWFAQYKVLELTGLKVPHFNFEVLKVFRSTDKAFEVELRASGKPTTCCSVCGIRLTNDESIKLGIGPICREKYGVTDFTALDKEIETKSVTFRTWLPRVAITDDVNFFNQLPTRE